MEGVQLTDDDKESIRQGLLIEALQKQKNCAYYTFNELERKLKEEKALKFSAKKFLRSFKPPSHKSVLELQDKISKLELQNQETQERFEKTMNFANEQLQKVKRERDRYLEGAAHFETLADRFQNEKITLIALFKKHEGFYEELHEKHETLKNQYLELHQKHEKLKNLHLELMKKQSTTPPIRQLK